MTELYDNNYVMTISFIVSVVVIYRLPFRYLECGIPKIFRRPEGRRERESQLKKSFCKVFEFKFPDNSLKTKKIQAVKKKKSCVGYFLEFKC